MRPGWLSKAAASWRTVLVRTRGTSAGRMNAACVDDPRALAPATTEEYIPCSHCALSTERAPQRSASGRNSPPRFPRTTTISSMPASQKSVMARSSTARPARSSNGLRRPMREEAPAASTMAARLFDTGALDVIVVFREDLLQARQAFGDDARTARHLVAHVVVHDFGALYASVSLGVLGFEPFDKLVEHGGEPFVRCRVRRSPAGVQAEQATSSGKHATGFAGVHAAQQAGHGAHQVLILFALGFEGQRNENLAALVALEGHVHYSQRVIVHGFGLHSHRSGRVVL